MCVLQGTVCSAASLRHSGSSVLPEVALVVKAADQGSLEAIMGWIATRNKQTQEAKQLSLLIEAALAAAAADTATAKPLFLEKDISNVKKVTNEERRKAILQMWKPLRVVRSGVGPVSESDVNYAQITGAIIFAFGVSFLDRVEEVR